MKEMIHGYIEVTYHVPDKREEIESMLRPYLQKATRQGQPNIYDYELICPISEWQRLTFELAPDATFEGKTGQKYKSSQIQVGINAYQIE